MSDDPMANCNCMKPPIDASAFESTPVGIDETRGRFAEVSVEMCRQCGRRWLRYFVEYEAFTGSGRWYRGLISEELARDITPSSAVRILEELEWYFYGGSYFRTTGRKGSGRLQVNV